MLDFVQDWLLDERLSRSRLVLVTRGAVAAADRGGRPRAGSSPRCGVWCARAQAENPERFMLVDIDEHDASTAVLPAALAIRRASVGYQEWQCARSAARAGGLGRCFGGSWGVAEWCLDAGGGGTLEDLSLVPAPEMVGSLGSGQVRVGVRAGGLNFRDVLIALGMYPGEAVVGGEGAGVVLECGPGVEGLAVGDRVMGLFSGVWSGRGR